jgi:hypothetical protein
LWVPKTCCKLKTLGFEIVRSHRSSLIVVMHAAYLSHLVYASPLRPLHRPGQRGIHLQRPMRAPVAIVRHVGVQHALEMLLMQYDHVIEALAPDTPDKPLRIGILPGTLRSDRQTSSKFSLRIWLDTLTLSRHRNSVKLQTLSFSHVEPHPAAMRPWRRVEPT